jgi:hypothetical protein
MLQITQRARKWWKENKTSILSATQAVLSIVEKGLDGLPVYGPQVVVGVVAEAVRAVQVRLFSRAYLASIILMSSIDRGRE